ncbi:extracellular calcium-sensing receptor-like [Polyodon spathula]|uniref:extracellular calcium-sensing receptor-like n=1 Tax=Polyodon spathula TaxID=7913 RepID=UPI001B7EDD16|nr:extracellular calcium-sensing receptor-like [Polyodon spathula]
MIFAIEEINNNTELLPNVTLGYTIFDTCATYLNALGAAMTLVTGDEEAVSNSMCGESPQVPVIIGDAISTASIIIARTLGVFRIPMVSYFASCACLSNRKEFPSFFRTVPSDNFQARAMARLLKLFGWTWVGVIAGDDDYGKFGIQLFREEIKKSDVCVAFSEIIPKVYSKNKIMQIVQTIKQSTAKVIVTFAIEGDIYSVLEEVIRQNITDKQWIATEGWITSTLISAKENLQSLRGTIGFAIRKAEIKGLKSFLCRIHPHANPADPFIAEFWETMFGCSLDFSVNETVAFPSSKTRCTGLEDLNNIQSIYNDVSQLRATYNVYKAVYAIAQAVHDLLLCKSGNGPFENGTCSDMTNLQPWQLTHYLSKVNCKSPVGEYIHFDENGNPSAAYDIINWQMAADGSVEFVQVGQFDATEESKNEFEIDEEKIVWSGGQSKVPKSVCSESCPLGTRRAVQKGQPVCCFDCLPCPGGEISNQTDAIECEKCPSNFWSNVQKTKCILKEIEYLSYEETMGVILAVVAIFGAGITAAVIAVFFYYKDTPIVKANNSELSFLLLFSLILCFLCSLTFIGQPLTWSCMLRHTVFGISFVLCISCVLSKTVVVLMAFKAALPGSNIMRYFGPMQQRAGIFFCTLVQVVICTLWLTLYPPFPSKNTQQSEKIILECNIGSVLGFASVLGYIGALACMCFVLAFLARKLPDNFNEAKFITFSMLIFCAVWITFIPAYVSSPGKYTVAVEIFAILSSSYGLLVCIFVPKCYIILLKPEKNTKKQMMSK